MDIRSSLDGLKSLLGVGQTSTPAAQPRNGAGSAQNGSALGSDRATVSSAGSEVSQAASDPGVRLDKVASIQSALSAGTYNVPASAVASKMIDSMLAAGS
jgi:flagellar biosynthesis anti-sigma factor FlgM